MEIQTLKVKDLNSSHHEFASRHLMMSKEVFIVFKDDIDKNGLLTRPLIINNLVLDGRNRIKALFELGVENVECEIIDSSTSDDRLREIVISSERRRHDSPNARVLMVLKDYFDAKERGEKIVLSDLINRENVGKTTVSKAKWLWENGKVEILEKLAASTSYREKIGIAKFSGKTISTTDIVKISNYYKDLKLKLTTSKSDGFECDITSTFDYKEKITSKEVVEIISIIETGFLSIEQINEIELVLSQIKEKLK